MPFGSISLLKNEVYVKAIVSSSNCQAVRGPSRPKNRPSCVTADILLARSTFLDEPHMQAIARAACRMMTSLQMTRHTQLKAMRARTSEQYAPEEAAPIVQESMHMIEPAALLLQNTYVNSRRVAPVHQTVSEFSRCHSR